MTVFYRRPFLRRTAWAGVAAALLLASCGPEPSRVAANEAAPDARPVAFTRLSADTRAHGERVARVLGCTGCHGDDLTGKDWSDPGFGTLWTSNLTVAVPLYDDAALERAIRGGVRHDGAELWAMPSHLFTHIEAGDMSALIAWLRARPPAGERRPLPDFGPLARREIAAGKRRSSAADVQASGNRWPPDTGAAHAQARYIVRGTCAECHGLALEGDPDQEQEKPAPPLAVVAGYDRSQFRHLMRTGEPVGGRPLRLMSDVARGRYAHLTEAEVDAVYDYLRAAQAAAASR
jgi:mono/diheme cytochrome c family protein